MTLKKQIRVRQAQQYIIRMYEFDLLDYGFVRAKTEERADTIRTLFEMNRSDLELDESEE